jgi:hypothetical protein
MEFINSSRDGPKPSFVVFKSIGSHSVIMLTTFQSEGLVKKPIIVSLFSFILVLNACTNFIQTNPTTIPTLTLTAVPSLASTNTPLLSIGTPDAVSEWNGIPIMPNAIAGEGDDEGYVFTVKATAQQVRDYYQAELGKLGWQLLTPAEGEASLKFMNNASETLTISLIAKGDQVLVLLVK